jgi:hypothetical protein
MSLTSHLHNAGVNDPLGKKTVNDGCQLLEKYCHLKSDTGSDSPHNKSHTALESPQYKWKDDNLKENRDNKQEAQGPYWSPECHATRNALIYAVENFMLVIIMYQTVNCFITLQQYRRKFLCIFNTCNIKRIHLWFYR